MATYRFILRKTKVDKPVSIYLLWSSRAGRVKINTGEKIHPKHWDSKRTRPTKGYFDYEQLSDLLKLKEEQILGLVRQFKLHTGNEPTPDQIRTLIKQSKLGQVTAPQQPSASKGTFFTEVYAEWIKQTSPMLRPSTVTVYKTVLKHVRNYAHAEGRVLTMEMIDLSFYDSFTAYLFQTAKVSSNTQSKIVKTIKTFLGWAKERGYIQHDHHKKFKRLKEATDFQYLTEEELALLEAFNGESRLQRVRDMFLFACFTGLRFSDLANLRPECIQNDRLVIRTIKTRNHLVIPLTHKAKSLIMKYEGEFTTISNQKFNQYLKELCFKSGITTPVIQTAFRGGVRSEISVPKHELISCHTARRTFVTLSLQKGVRAEVVMRVTGHSSLKTMQRYVKVIDSVIQSELLTAWDVDK
jgi:integrase